MLRVNVGLSRKISKDYNSTGYSVNLEGEVTAPVSDPEAVVEQVKELYDLADEALCRQIERYESTSAIASRDEETRQKPPASRKGNGFQKPTRVPHQQPPRAGNGNEAGSGGNGRSQEPATNKQIQYLLSIGKRQRLTTVQLENRIAEIIGQPVGVYDLSKTDAGIVIDALTNGVKAR